MFPASGPYFGVIVNLNDLENEVLFNTQQSELINYGGAPNWAKSTNPYLTQAAVDFQINRAYRRVIQDLADIQLALYRLVLYSLKNVSDYALPPNTLPQYTSLGSSFLGSLQLNAPPGAGSTGVWGEGQWGSMVWSSPPAPRVQRITRVIYSPAGQPWSQDMEGNIRLVSWQEFMRRCAFGYLRPFTFGIIPDYCAVTPDRQMLSFFPGTATQGDAIGIEYVPELTPNSAWDELDQPTDTPQLPEETHDLIVLWATHLIWFKLREFGAADYFKTLYHGPPQERGSGGELGRIINVLKDRSSGDTLAIRDANDGLALSYLTSGALIP